MLIIIEIDRNWTVGIDWFKNCKGIRLGFLGVHFVSCTLEQYHDLIIEKQEELKELRRTKGEG